MSNARNKLVNKKFIEKNKLSYFSIALIKNFDFYVALNVVDIWFSALGQITI